jgi:hypothetical protein
LLLCLLISTTYRISVVVGEVIPKTDPQQLHKELAEWLNGLPGGYFNPKQEIRKIETTDENDENAIYGVFAKEFIPKGEVLNQVPWEYIINEEEDDESLKEQDEEDGNIRCGTARNLAREMKHAETSKFGPYARYLLSQPRGVIPSSWSRQGRNMFNEVLGLPNQKIPPKEADSWLDDDWFFSCHGDPKDELGAHAAMQVLARADDDLLVPIYDVSIYIYYVFLDCLLFFSLAFSISDKKSINFHVIQS